MLSGHESKTMYVFNLFSTFIFYINVYLYFSSQSKSVWSTVEMTDVLPLIIILICGGFTSFILLATEKLLFKKFAKNKQENFSKRFITNVKYPLSDKYPIKINVF